MNVSSTPKFKTRHNARLVLAACALFGAAAAQAGGTISMGPDKSISLGLGLKTSYTSAEKGALNGTDRSSDFNVDSARLYVGASLSKYIKLNFNTEKDGSSNVKVLDANGELLIDPAFNLILGRTIVPADRANLSGGYYMPAWEFAGVASQYPSTIASRDDGAVAWGKFFGGKLVYSAGVFQGRNRGLATGSNQGNTNMVAGRLAFHFWDPEPAPNFLTGSTYYGSANILTVGIAGQRQNDGVGSANLKDDYQAWSIDGLLETKLGGAGVITVEGAYYKYDFSAAAAGVDASGANSVAPGKAGLVSLAYLIPGKFGWGQFQPYYRYQKFDAETTAFGAADMKQNDLGFNYLIDGANARVVTTWRKKQVGSGPNLDALIIGLQLQY